MAGMWTVTLWVMIHLLPLLKLKIKDQQDTNVYSSLTRTCMPSCSTGVLSYVAVHTLTRVLTPNALRSYKTKHAEFTTTQPSCSFRIRKYSEQMKHMVPLWIFPVVHWWDCAWWGTSGSRKRSPLELVGSFSGLPMKNKGQKSNVLQRME